MEFVPYEKEYLSDLTDILNYYIRNSIATYALTPLTEEQMEEKCNNGKTFVVLEGLSVIGYFSIGKFNEKGGYSRTAEISIYLRPERTGRGIGKDILDFVEKEAKAESVKVIIAHVSSANSESVKFFDKNGWERSGHLKGVGFKFGRVLDDYFYQKTI